MARARGGSVLGLKSKTELCGLGFGEQPAGGLGFEWWGVDWGGISGGSGPGPAQSSGARGGGLVRATSQNKATGSLLANGMQGASVSGRGDLGGVEGVQLREVGVVIGLVSRGAGFAHSLCYPSPLPFSYPFPLQTIPYNTPPHLHNPPQ